MKNIFKRLFASALIAVCALTAIPVYAAAQTEEVRAVYLGVLDYGTETSANKDNFIHRFYADGEEIRLPISSEGDYAVQNGLQEGYLYDLTLKNSEVISAVSPKADGEGKTTAAGENHVTVGGKAFSFTEIYVISN